MSTGNTPHPLSRAEWEEIAALPEVVASFGFHDLGLLDRVVHLNATACDARFDFAEVKRGPRWADSRRTEAAVSLPEDQALCR